MNSRDDNFYQMLDLGTKAEDEVYNWLISRYSFVQDTRHQVYEAGFGPRLKGAAGSVVLPDFIVYDKYQGRIAIDVKYKSSVYPINGKPCFTVDDYKFEDYLRCVSLLGLDRLMIVFKFNNSLFFYEADESIGKYSFENNFGKSAYLFEYNEGNIKK